MNRDRAAGRWSVLHLPRASPLPALPSELDPAPAAVTRTLRRGVETATQASHTRLTFCEPHARWRDGARLLSCGSSPDRPSTVHPQPRPLPPRPRTRLWPVGTTRARSCSALVVSHHLDGLLRVCARRSVAPCSRSWGSRPFWLRPHEPAQALDREPDHPGRARTLRSLPRRQPHRVSTAVAPLPLHPLPHRPDEPDRWTSPRTTEMLEPFGRHNPNVPRSTPTADRGRPDDPYASSRAGRDRLQSDAAPHVQPPSQNRVVPGHQQPRERGARLRGFAPLPRLTISCKHEMNVPSMGFESPPRQPMIRSGQT
jgi:hypothetical protein